MWCEWGAGRRKQRKGSLVHWGRCSLRAKEANLPLWSRVCCPCTRSFSSDACVTKNEAHCKYRERRRDWRRKQHQSVTQQSPPSYRLFYCCFFSSLSFHHRKTDTFSFRRRRADDREEINRWRFSRARTFPIHQSIRWRRLQFTQKQYKSTWPVLLSKGTPTHDVTCTQSEVGRKRSHNHVVATTCDVYDLWK